MFAFSTSMLFTSLVHTAAFGAFWAVLKLAATGFVLAAFVKKVKARRQHQREGTVRLEEEERVVIGEKA
jgi:protein-S-isoprenylcysteine O-methyltransferase Ste14